MRKVYLALLAGFMALQSGIAMAGDEVKGDGDLKLKVLTGLGITLERSFNEWMLGVCLEEDGILQIQSIHYSVSRSERSVASQLPVFYKCVLVE